MNYFVLLIFFTISCTGMEHYSSLELMPTDLKMDVIKQIIARSETLKQAIVAVRIFVVADRKLHKHDDYSKLQAIIEDYLGWHWNDEVPVAFIPDTFTCDLFETFPQESCDRPIGDIKLMKSHQNFAQFCKMLKEKKQIPEDVLIAIDPYHCYNTHELYEDATLAIGRVRKQTPLCAATHANDATTVERLLQLGCDTQKLSNSDMNPLHMAAKKNYPSIVALLIKYAAPLNAQTRAEQKTAMHLAAENGHMDIMHMLVTARADRNIKDSQGCIPSERIKGRIAVA